MHKILVVDDDPGVLAAFEELLCPRGHLVITAECAETGLAFLSSQTPDIVLLDVCMPGIGGIEAFRRIKQLHPLMPVIVTTGHGSTETAIEAAMLGAFDYQLKPFEPETMIRTVERALECVREMKSTTPATMPECRPLGIIGQSPGMLQVYRAIGRVAPTDATVLIRGESGTGKELVAQSIHRHSLRREKAMVIVNCVAIPETLLESELFGHERGAFTGADGRRTGKFELAGGGTIFLDEIGDLSMGTQSKILRVLQERTFSRIGGNQTIRADVRVIAATNRDLENAIAERQFREDLYHRLKVVTVSLPPVRDRREDIPELVSHFLARAAAELGVQKPAIAKEAMDLLVRYSWPGNVREIENCVSRAAIFTRGLPIQARDIDAALEDASATARSRELDARLMDVVREHLRSSPGPRAHADLLLKAERMMLTHALQMAGGRQAAAARLLGIPRPTLHAKLHKHGLAMTEIAPLVGTLNTRQKADAKKKAIASACADAAPGPN